MYSSSLNLSRATGMAHSPDLSFSRFVGEYRTIETRTGPLVRYATSPTVGLIARQVSNFDAMYEWYAGFGIGSSYSWEEDMSASGQLPETDLVRAAGQLCYLSPLTPGFTRAEGSGGYVQNALGAGHGSIAEHAVFTLFMGGVSRSFSHELVRHRHISPSQVSQRYVDGRALRFVMRPEYLGDAEEEMAFEKDCLWHAGQYEARAERIKKKLAATLTGTARRKAANQTARAVLPNEAETAVIMTGNARAWRWFLYMRGSAQAEPEIRRVAWMTAKILTHDSPVLFQDVHAGPRWEDGCTVVYAKA